MKKVTLPEEFVIEAHKAACAEWKAKIEKQLPELFEPVYKMGDLFVKSEPSHFAGRRYILSTFSTGCFEQFEQFATLVDVCSGGTWNKPIKVCNPGKITKKELDQITDNKSFKLIQ
jgi:hypothetical protein